MERTIIQKHMSERIKSVIEKSKVIQLMDSPTVVGDFRELFVSELINQLLPSNYETGSGIIVNQQGKKSPQLDVIIYDQSFLSPFIKNEKLGVYPAESVLAIIEVRSKLNRTELKKLNKKANELFEKLYAQKGSIYPEFIISKPFFTVFGYKSDTKYDPIKLSKLRDWIFETCKQIDGICLLDVFSWFNLGAEKRKNHFKRKDDYNEETKSFLGILLDNIISKVKLRNRVTGQHRDFIGIYIRDQGDKFFPIE